MLTLKINGSEKRFSENEFPATLSELLAKLNIAEETVVAEIDGQIVERKDFAETKLKQNNCVELVRFVGGG